MQRVFLSLIAPTLSVAAVAMFGTLTAKNLAFTDESNFATSGGFGPNQVSGALALGIVCALVWLLANKDGWINKGIIFAVLAFLGIQSALTFSRGGLYNAAGSAVIAIYYLMRDRGSRLRVIAAVGVILLVAIFIVAPRLDTFTGGAISTRFKDVDLAHRDDILRSDLALWQENPVLGVGPGRAAIGRSMPHTEVTRLLAEHGLFGLTALIVLLISAVQAARQAPTNAGKALSGAMVTFTFAFLCDKAMRLVAPSFAFGLAFATLMPDEMEPKRQSNRSNGLGSRPKLKRSWRRRPTARVRPRTSPQSQPSTQLCLLGPSRPQLAGKTGL
jgi:O-antigen ligase